MSPRIQLGKLSARAALIAGICLLVSFAVSAAPVSVRVGNREKHFLWRVTNAPAPVYLLGSIHIMRANDYPLPAPIEDAIKASQQYYFEYDPRGDDELTRRVKAA